MLSFLAFLSLSAFAGPKTIPETNYTYQAQVIAGQADCATEATNWAQKFASATGAKVKSASCRSEQILNADSKFYQIYNLGLTYAEPTSYTPYSVIIGKRDPMAPVRLYQEAIYPTMDNCLADVQNQKVAFEAETGLPAVTATCISDISYATTKAYFVKIEGFDSNKNYGRAQPKKYLYTFAPQALENLPVSRQSRILEFLTPYNATIVKEAPGIFIYYRAGGPLPVNAEDVAFNKYQVECEAQISTAQEIFERAGSKNIIVWCNNERLVAIHDGNYYLNQMYGANQTQYAGFEQCLADKEFVLSDVRNSQALGAVCATGTYDINTYTMTLFRKDY